MNEKEKQLGIPYGTANNRLKKILLFNYVKLSNQNFCYQCKGEIKDIKNFSIEHKEPWLHSDTPKELFFSLENIAYSHLKCNSKARRNKSEYNYKHPSIYAYNVHKCRCEECRNIKKQYNIKRYKK